MSHCHDCGAKLTTPNLPARCPYCRSVFVCFAPNPLFRDAPP